MSQPLEVRPLKWRDLRHVMDRYLCGKSTVYRNMAEGKFPKPVRLGTNTTRWPDHELDALDQALLAEKSDDEIVALVQQLAADRKARA